MIMIALALITVQEKKKFVAYKNLHELILDWMALINQLEEKRREKVMITS